MANIAYIRVSTTEQNDGRQYAGLEKYGIDKWFEDKLSGKDRNRPQLEAMIDYVREGDTLYVLDFSRLARSTADLLSIVNELRDKGVTVVSDKENFDTSTPAGKMMMTMLAAIYEFERENLLQRQREGIAIAKEAKKYKGRKPVEIEDSIFKTNYERYMKREISKTELAKTLKISRPTLDKMIAEHTKNS